MDASTNQAFVCDQYWADLMKSQPYTNISSSYRTAYQPDAVWHPNDYPADSIAGSLRKAIISLHQLANNAITDGYTIVMAHGGTQLTHAAFYALAKLSGRPLTVFAQVIFLRSNPPFRVLRISSFALQQTPYYYLIPDFANLNPGSSKFNSSLRLLDPLDNILEVITSPNNPDG